MTASHLNRPTLVLNRGWHPVGVTPVSRSLVMLWNGVAQAVDHRDYQTFTWADWAELEPLPGEPFIQGVRVRLRIPEVIVLTHYDRIPTYTVPFSRRNLYKRDHYTCQYCGATPGGKELTIDHVIPRSRGGKSTWENCVLACVSCNHRKADRTVAEAGLTLAHKPHRPRWQPRYATRDVPLSSWSKFLSEAYWNVTLGE